MQRSFWTRQKQKIFVGTGEFIFVVVNEVFSTDRREAYFAVASGLIAFILSESYVDGKRLSLPNLQNSHRLLPRGNPWGLYP